MGHSQEFRMRQRQPFIWDNPGKLAPELTETLTQVITIVLVKLLTSISNLPPQASHSTSRIQY